MTINIALATSDSLVLGCDSVASAREFYLDPFQMPWERDSSGQLIKDADGKYSLKFEYSDLTGGRD